MNAAISVPASGRLIFNWDPPRRHNLAIAGFLVASFMAHAFSFYLFQIVYPPTVALLPPPARVSLINSNSDEGRALLRWVDAEDPALASTTWRAPEAKAHALPKVPHVPSYFATEPALKEAPPLVADLRIPSSQSLGPVPMVHPHVVQPISVVSTSVSFSKEIRDLGAPRLPPANFKASTNEPPESVRFRIAVGNKGVVRYCFPLDSSGDSALDEQARSFVALCRFPARSAGSEDSLVWGIAAMEWSNDVAHPRRPTTSRAP
jgi:hypothetical protein